MAARRHPLSWLDRPDGAFLDVGCNVGALLEECALRFPSATLAGVDVNQEAVERARGRLPQAELHVSPAEGLPFADASFDLVACMEVLEHLPADGRAAVFAEIARVLRPTGTAVVSVPHAGRFDWLDADNFRFRLPALHGFLVGEGLKDKGYREAGRPVEWHHHFALEELRSLANGHLNVVDVHRGGLVLAPLSGILRWPFYRMRRTSGRAYRMLEDIARRDLQRERGEAAANIQVAFRLP